MDAPLDRIHWLGEHIVGVTQSSPQEECDAGFTDLEGCKDYSWDCMARRMGKKMEPFWWILQSEAATILKLKSCSISPINSQTNPLQWGFQPYRKYLSHGFILAEVPIRGEPSRPTNTFICVVTYIHYIYVCVCTYISTICT